MVTKHEIHIFAMFFMVLDLRLTKIGPQRSPFFYPHKPTRAYDDTPFRCHERHNNHNHSRHLNCSSATGVDERSTCCSPEPVCDLSNQSVTLYLAMSMSAGDTSQRSLTA